MAKYKTRPQNEGDFDCAIIDDNGYIVAETYGRLDTHITADAVAFAEHICKLLNDNPPNKGNDLAGLGMSLAQYLNDNDIVTNGDGTQLTKLVECDTNNEAEIDVTEKIGGRGSLAPHPEGRDRGGYIEYWERGNEKVRWDSTREMWMQMHWDDTRQNWAQM